MHVELSAMEIILLKGALPKGAEKSITPVSSTGFASFLGPVPAILWPLPVNTRVPEPRGP